MTRAPGRTLAFSLLAAGLLTGQPATKPPAQCLKNTVEQIIRDYIPQHPEVVVESLRGAREKTRAAKADKARGAITTRQTELAKDLLTPAAGNPSSGVTLTFFFDYRCGYCKKVTADLLPLTQADSPVRVVFKEDPSWGRNRRETARPPLTSPSLASCRTSAPRTCE